MQIRIDSWAHQDNFDLSRSGLRRSEQICSLCHPGIAANSSEENCLLVRSIEKELYFQLSEPDTELTKLDLWLRSQRMCQKKSPRWRRNTTWS